MGAHRIPKRTFRDEAEELAFQEAVAKALGETWQSMARRLLREGFARAWKEYQGKPGAKVEKVEG